MPRPARVSVSTFPTGATISVNGRTNEHKTPWTFEVEPNAPQTISVSLPDYQPTNKTVTLRPNGQTNLTFTLTPPPARVSISTDPPGAIILTNGVVTGQRTPATLELQPNVPHIISVSLPDYYPATNTVTLGPNGQTNLAFTLMPRPARVSVSTFPTGATISVNGRTNEHKTPWTFEVEPNAPQTISVSLPGYQSTNKTVILGPNTQTNLSFTLIPAESPLRITNSVGIVLIWGPTLPLANGRQGGYVAIHELTGQQYTEVRANNPSAVPGTNLPVTNVSLNDAIIFCAELTRREKPAGWKYTLPTDRQWEVFAEAPAVGEYPDYTNEVNELSRRTTLAGPGPVGTSKTNEFGLYDLWGNVWEMTLDTNRMGRDFKTRVPRPVKYKEPMNSATVKSPETGARLILIPE